MLDIHDRPLNVSNALLKIVEPDRVKPRITLSHGLSILVRYRSRRHVKSLTGGAAAIDLGWRTVFELFEAPWSDLDVQHVETFLARAEKEGVTWEAKADSERAGLRPESIRKAVCGLANQIGGYLIIGAHEGVDCDWQLAGISCPDDDAELWIGRIVRGLRPVPRFDVKSWPRDGEKVAAVVRVEPVAVPPCMTPNGRVYERVTGETLPVEDPLLLDKLFRRGQEARDRAAQLAPRASDQALEASGWTFQKSVGVAVGLAPLGRETDDVGSLLFTEGTRAAMAEAAWEMLARLRPGGQPDDVDHKQRQDSYAVALHFDEHKTFGLNHKVEATTRSTWLVQGNWDGTVAASLTLSDGDVANGPPPEDLIVALWTPLVPLCERLGGYGPSQLSVVLAVTQTSASVGRGQVVHAPGRMPPKESLYARLPEATRIGRLVDLEHPSDELVASIGREIKRAAGQIQDES